MSKISRNAAKDLTTGSPMKLIVSFSLPLFFGFLFQQAYSLVDTLIVGRFLGVGPLAAVGSTGSLNFMILGFCMGACNGFAIPVSQAFGARDARGVRRYVAGGAYLSVVLAVVMTVLTVIFLRPLLTMLQTPADIFEDAYAYILIIFAGIPVMMFYNILSSIIRALGDSKTPVYFLVISSLLNIVLDLAFILLLHMGVAGAAWATVISQGISGALCLATMRKKYPILTFEPGDWGWHPHHMRKLLSMGVPMGLQFAITAIGSVILQSSVNNLGSTAVAAVTAASKLSMLFCCVFDALASTMATYAGQNMGARRLDRITSGLNASAIIGTVYCIIAFALVYFFGHEFMLLFVDAAETAVIDSAYQFLLINAAFYIPLLFVNIVRLSIQGMGFTPFAVFAGVFEMVARTLVGIFLVPVFGLTAACYASPIAWVAADAFLVPAFAHVMRRMRKMLAPSQGPAQGAALDLPKGQ